MKKNKSISNEMRNEYKRSDFTQLERGKYYKRVTTNSNIVILDPDIAQVFPNAAAVNETLHALVDVMQKVSSRSATRRKRHKAD